jgi:para-aminobenzoate synthetase/4-amino-4-deoxychorismate lyase
MSAAPPEPIALVQDGAPDRWLRFAAPVAVVEARAAAEVAPALAAVARRVETDGLWAAGWIAYEAAPGFDRALAVRPPAPDGPPLVWFALFRDAEPEADPLAAIAGEYRLGRWRPSISRAGHRRGVAAIRRLIARGDTYQVNFTHRLRTRFEGDPRALFRDLARAQRGRHAAYLDAGRFAVCAATPELFFALDGERLLARPMKGTAHRGLTAEADRDSARRLAASAKERAENLMIVDMVRNDLGRVARPGTVAVEELFAVERYPTLLQMTSTVRAATDATVEAILAALFPCASITGAPKAATSAIIARLEDGPRGVYTGAVGYLGPGRRARFGVAIRTAVIDRERGEAVYGVGGGIVWDSRPGREWRECRLKARVLDAGSLARPWPDRFELLETLRWEPAAGFALVAEHLARLEGSAAYFDFRYDRGAVTAALERAVAGAAEPLRVRLTLDRRGEARVETAPLACTGWLGDGAPSAGEPDEPAAETVPAETVPAGMVPAGMVPAGTVPAERVPGAAGPPLRLGLAPGPVDPGDPFLYHKTTHRALYETAQAARPECDEVLLWNPRGEATEGTVHNLVVRRGGELVTPPVEAGLLPGTLRARLLAEGTVREATVRLDELTRRDELWLINSVRGWRRAELAVESTRPST